MAPKGTRGTGPQAVDKSAFFALSGPELPNAPRPPRKPFQQICLSNAVILRLFAMILLPIAIGCNRLQPINGTGAAATEIE
jgi:hypothetical protein